MQGSVLLRRMIKFTLTYMLGIVMLYSPSSGLSKSRQWLAPSMMVAAEFPRNLDFGRISPHISSLFCGEVKYLLGGAVKCQPTLIGLTGGNDIPSRNGRVMRNLFGYIVGNGSICIIVTTPKELS